MGNSSSFFIGYILSLITIKLQPISLTSQPDMNPFMGASGITGPSSRRNPFEQLNQSPIQLEVKAGDLWCIKENGEDWPVVICDEEIVQKFSKGKPRPANARRSNGTWTKESAGNKCYPALVPGTLKM